MRVLTPRVALLCLLVALAAAVYAPNLRDYFVSDDFELIGSCFDRSPSYLLSLLYNNQVGDLWKDWGLDPTAGRGYLRPIPIWLMKLDCMIWGMRPLGFRLTATAFFAAVIACVFLILETLQVRRSVAFLTAWGLAIHPIFSAIVPLIWAREETVTATFGLVAFCFFLRLRRSGSSAVPVFVFYALALFTKETAVTWLALPVGYDLIFGHFRGKAPQDRRRLVAFYGGLFGLAACYLALRWIAFGNMVGGDAAPTHYFSLDAFIGYHARFFRLLVGARLFDDHGIRALRWVAPGAVLVVLALAFRRSTGSLWPRRAVFFGPYWYLCATTLFYGIYYDDRHHAFVIVGLGLLLGLATHVVMEPMSRAGRAVLFVVAIAAMTAVWLPATLRNARQFHEASRVTASVREAIDTLTAGLSDGSTVRLVNTPLSPSPPYYFGWGLQSALRQPFTPSDCSKRLTIVDAGDLRMNHRAAAVSRFDLEIRFRAKPLGAIESVRGTPDGRP